MVAPWPENQPDRSPQVVLALGALRIGKPGYVTFALGFLRDLIAGSREAFPIKEYFRLVGVHDPMGVRFAAVTPTGPSPPRGCLAIVRRVFAALPAWPKRKV